ncbi:MAG: DNA polymerase I [Acidobacteriota bacterium]
MADTLYLVDASSILFRAFYAVRDLSTRDGRPTNAIFGTLKMAEKILRDLDPAYIAFVFDTAAPTFRHEAFEAYKANRPPMDPRMASQIEPAKEILRAMGLVVLEREGYEADDLIGTLCARALAEGMEVVVVTADKDLFQLVRPGVRILHTKKEDVLLDERGVEELFGVPPHRVVDVLALWGDPTDNIPGVPGIGEKGAKELVRRYGDLESVLRHAGEVERKAYREGLLAHADAARFSRELATVKCDVPLDVGPRELKRGAPDEAALQEFFRRWEFTSLLKAVPPPAARLGRAEAPPLGDEGLGALRRAEAAGALLEGDRLFLSDGERAWSLPAAALSPEDFGSLRLSTHGLKGLLRALDPFTYRPAAGSLDLAVAGYLLDPSARVPSPEELAERFLSVRPEEGDPAGKALLLARLAPAVRGELRRLEMEGLYDGLEGPLVPLLARMEAAGMAVDLPVLEGLGKEMAEALSRLEREIHRLAGVEFNVASPRQVGEVLFGKLGLPVQKRTAKTKSYSTDNEVLEALRPAHPVVPLLLEHRLLSKLKGTYVDALPAAVDEKTGRIHAAFHQTVAATGRLSSSDPNLQNIPARGEWGPRIRGAFVAGAGCLFAGADYSQIELRVLAHLSGDEALAKIFQRGEDIHTATASEVFGVAPAFVTPDMRRQAKAVNFGILYGMGPFGLARELQVSQKEAKAFIERYFSRFPGVRGYVEAVTEEVLRREEVSTLLGRRRLFPGIARAAKPLQQALLRQAVNTTVQGSAADLIKKAMVDVEPRLPEGCRLVLQVHDELLVEAPEGKAPEAAKVLKESMESALPLKVPLVAGTRIGKRWSDLK